MKQLILVVALITGVACSESGKNVKNEKADMILLASAEKEPQTDSPEIEGSEPDMTDVIADEIYLNGTLALPPQNFASVTLVMGGIIHSTNLIPGKFVRKGEVLAMLENIDFVTLQQNFLEAAAQTEYLEAEYYRQKNLSEQEAASKKRFQESKAEYLSMKSRKEATAAQLQMLGVSTEVLLRDGISPFLSVKAPITGYVTGMNMNVGKHFQEGEQICEIVNKEQVMLNLTVYEKDLIYLKPGGELKFTVNGTGKKEFTATILSIGQEVNTASRSLEVYAKVEGTHELFRPGMYVTARVNKK